MLSVRIVNADHYLSAPVPGIDPTNSVFRYNTPIKQVPMIRLYGSTPAGQKTLLHIHGVFPYIYIPFEKNFKRQFVPETDEDDANDPNECAPIKLLLVRMANSIDKALNISMGRGTGCSDQHIFRILVVKGRSFYGYHPDEEEFLKIYLFNPSTAKKLAELLLAGAVMNRSFQPHETHVPFMLQFFIDYNLYGMNFVYLTFAQFRPFLQVQPSPYDSLVETLKKINTQRSSQSGWWSASSTPERFMLPQTSPFAKRQGRCQLEVDAVAADIINRRDLEVNTAGDNPGLAALWKDEKARRRNNKESSFIKTQASNDSSCVKDSDKLRSKSDLFFLSKLDDKLDRVETPSSVKERPLASEVMDHREGVPSSLQASHLDSEPLVDEMSILEVVTQSARGKAAASQMMERTYSGDETVIDILSDLVGNDESESGEEEAEEENDCREDEDDDDEFETHEMTQAWVPPWKDIRGDDEDETETCDDDVEDGEG